MKKRIISIALVLIIALSLLPTIATAASNLVLNVEKTTFTPGERFTTTVSGIGPNDNNNNIIAVALCRPDDPYFENIYSYDEREGGVFYWHRGTGTASRTFTAPAIEGQWELRLFSNGNAKPPVFVSKLAITIERAASNLVLNVEKTEFSPGEQFRTTVSNIGPNDNNDNVIAVALCRPDDPYFDNIYTYDEREGGVFYWHRGTGTASRFFTAPAIEGQWELRLFSNGVTKPPIFVSKLAITVGDANALDPTPITQTPEPADPNTSTQTTGLTAETGVKLSWSPIENALYYRVYRSTVQGEEGISITDFAITGTDYVDVNVNARTTYYYTVRGLYKEATVTGEPEELGAPSDPVTVTTGESILGGNASDMPDDVMKNIIMMQIDNPYMSVNGVHQEVDPGMGTTPLLRNGRTLVPIRAIIEAMGGEVDYDIPTRTITLDCSGYQVKMWPDRKDFTVNNEPKEMDVAPEIIGNRTRVPLRFTAENVGCVVEWVDHTREILIIFYTGGQPPEEVLQPQDPADPDPETDNTDSADPVLGLEQ